MSFRKLYNSVVSDVTKPHYLNSENLKQRTSNIHAQVLLRFNSSLSIFIRFAAVCTVKIQFSCTKYFFYETFNIYNLSVLINFFIFHNHHGGP